MIDGTIRRLSIVTTMQRDPFIVLSNSWENDLKLHLKADLRQDQPDMLQMLPIKDDSDPMSIILGNPNLKKIINQHT